MHCRYAWITLNSHMVILMVHGSFEMENSTAGLDSLRTLVHVDSKSTSCTKGKLVQNRADEFVIDIKVIKKTVKPTIHPHSCLTRTTWTSCVQSWLCTGCAVPFKCHDIEVKFHCHVFIYFCQPSMFLIQNIIGYFQGQLWPPAECRNSAGGPSHEKGEDNSIFEEKKLNSKLSICPITWSHKKWL